MVIDFDPDVVTALKRQGRKAIYGDISDPDIFEAIDLRKTKIVICTVPDAENTHHFLAALRRLRGKGNLMVVARAETEEDAVAFRAAGVDHVFLPAAESGYHLGHLLAGGSVELFKRRLRAVQKGIEL